MEVKDSDHDSVLSVPTPTVTEPETPKIFPDASNCTEVSNDLENDSDCSVVVDCSSLFVNPTEKDWEGFGPDATFCQEPLIEVGNKKMQVETTFQAEKRGFAKNQSSTLTTLVYPEHLQ